MTRYRINKCLALIEETNSRFFKDTSIDEEIETLRKKNNDKFYNVGIIGEFNAGKSSFINTLLGEPLLDTGAVQGTTVVNTMITFKKNTPCLQVTNKNGETNIIYDNLKENIEKYSTVDEISTDISSLILCHNSKFLKRKINIIDTPGVSSLNQQHEKTTRKAIKDNMDVIIVLTPAEQVFTNSLSDFIEDAINDSVKDCLFVITKYDLLQTEKDKEQVLSRAKNIINNNWNLSEEKVLPFSSDSFREKQLKNEKKISKKTIKTIRSYVRTNKGKIKAQKLGSLLNKINESINKRIDDLIESNKKEHARIEKIQVEDLNSFIRTKKNYYFSCLESELNIINNDINLWLSSLKTLIENEIFGWIDKEKDKDSLKELIKNLEITIKDYLEELYSSKINETLSKVNEAFVNQKALFEKEFFEMYKRLLLERIEENLPIEIDEKGNELIVFSNNESNSLKKIADDKEGFSEETIEAAAIVTAAVVSFPAAIVVGLSALLINFVIDIFNTVEKMQQKAKKKLEPKLQETAEKFTKSFSDAINTAENNVKNDFQKLLDQYLSLYQSKVSILINEDKRRQNELQNDCNLLNGYKKLLMSYNVQY